MTIDKFNAKVWSGRILHAYYERAVYPSLCNRDWEGEINEKGDTVKILSLGEVTITSGYTKNTDLATPQVLDDGETFLTIDQADTFHFYIDDVDKRQQNPKLMSEAALKAGIGVRLAADTYVGALMRDNVASANQLGSKVVGAFDTSAYDLLVDMGTQLDESLVDELGRWVVVPAWYIGELEKDTRYTGFNTAEAAKNMRNGLRGVMANGMMVHSIISTRVPQTSSKATVIAGANTACTFADQINKTTAYSPEKRFGDAMKGLHTYGGKVIRPNHLVSAVVERAA